MSEQIEFTPENNLQGVTFTPALDLNVALDYQIHLINNCVQWMAENPNVYDAFHEHCIKCTTRAFKQIQHLQKQIQIETAIDEEDSE